MPPGASANIPPPNSHCDTENSHDKKEPKIFCTQWKLQMLSQFCLKILTIFFNMFPFFTLIFRPPPRNYRLGLLTPSPSYSTVVHHFIIRPRKNAFWRKMSEKNIKERKPIGLTNQLKADKIYISPLFISLCWREPKTLNADPDTSRTPIHGFYAGFLYSTWVLCRVPMQRY